MTRSSEGLSQMKKYLAEGIGTFALVLVGTGAIVVSESFPGSLAHTDVSFVFGLIVMIMIYAVGDISGAHLNPAVTVGFWASRRLSGKQVCPYVISQIVGAVLASGLIQLWFPSHRTLGATAPAGSIAQAFSVEVALSCFLMFTILGVATGAKEKGVMAGVAVGASVGLCALVGGPVTGASMNPARSLAPALISGRFEDLWIYLIAPLVGALLAVVACRCIRERDCCAPASHRAAA